MTWPNNSWEPESSSGAINNPKYRTYAELMIRLHAKVKVR